MQLALSSRLTYLPAAVPSATNLDFRLILLRQVTPARYTSLAGCDSTLRRARPNGSSRVGRHQPEMSESPTIYVHIPGKWFTLTWPWLHEKTRCSKNICHCSFVPPRQRHRMWPRSGQILFYLHLALDTRKNKMFEEHLSLFIRAPAAAAQDVATEWSNPEI